ncbi:LPXTG cell wall anchor domain-containing protein [Streptomyces sp. A0958]|uniref:WGxxGxxG family protein n=1 Tax=Streptomyces sp. A0958 TaxID=2563101 RepID=UPI00109E878F|nr:WGxxGxxG family protein [Streptomyces sp. A0958]THA66054.1 LPXTG cell wall anchor domain-containing protein [Streptomyces sp. A0958]
MRHTAATLSLTAALLLAPAAPALAQTGTAQAGISVAAAPTPTNEPNMTDDKDDSSGGWGLWGLVGLLGLAGLIPRKKKENNVPRTRGTGPAAGPTSGSHPTDPRA